MSDDAKGSDNASVSERREFQVTDIDVFVRGGVFVVHGKGCGQDTAKLLLSVREDGRKGGLEELKAALAQMRVNLKI